MRYRQFKISDRKHYTYTSLRIKSKKLDCLIKTIKDLKRYKREMKQRLNNLRNGNLRRNLVQIVSCLKQYTYYQEALHYFRLELTTLYLELHPKKTNT